MSTTELVLDHGYAAHAPVGTFPPNHFGLHEIPPATEALRFEPQSKWPPSSPCAGPAARIKDRRGAKLEMVLRLVDGQKHLPLLKLKRAA